MSGFTRACLKLAGTVPDDNEALMRFVMEWMTDGRIFFSSDVGIGSNSQVAFFVPRMIVVTSSSLTILKLFKRSGCALCTRFSGVLQIDSDCVIFVLIVTIFDTKYFWNDFTISEMVPGGSCVSAFR